MEKHEREWVAMMLAELTTIGLPKIVEHYRYVLVSMDPLLENEYKACIRTFRIIEKENFNGNGTEGSCD